ncbi:MAG: ABC transporter ATP-binding protein [Anaerolineae bacterium]|jgi:ABC-2 type transport system ATP-binding protein|nr:ABC transporter ATP-binding protein [Anaerolineae bacterium]
MENIIKTNGLNKRYGNSRIINDLNLAVLQNSVYGFLGPNGAGKTTTMKMVVGLVRPSDGMISVFGKELNPKNRLEILKGIGSLIESPSYYGHLTGEENLQIITTLKNIPEKDISRVLSIVRLEKQKDKQVNNYSLGMKQRLGLAGALLGNPRLLILDEPTNGLDPAGIQEMRDLICSFPKQYGMTVMVSSHLLSEIDQIATDVGIINHGRLIFQGSISSLREKSTQQIAIRTLDNGSAANVLKTQGFPCEKQDSFLIISKHSDEEIAHVVKELVDHNIPLVRIEERNNNLEDIFLKLTGKASEL